MDMALEGPIAGGKRAVSDSGALAALALRVLLASLGTSAANVALPALAKAFDASFQQVQWVVLAYLLAMTTAIVGVGRLGDITGRKRLLSGGVLLFTSGAILAGLAPSLGVLIFARAIQGFAAATLMALSTALLGEAVSPARSGTAMGLIGAMSAVGTALGPAVGGLLIGSAGWRSIFFFMVPIGTIAFAFAQYRLPKRASSAVIKRERFDLVGMMILCATLSAFTMSMTLGRERLDALNIALFVAALIGLIAFLRWQVHTASPLIPLATLRHLSIRSGLAMSLLISAVLMATLVIGPFYLSGALGLGATATGMALSIGPIVAACTGVPAGRAVDRVGAPAVTLAGLIAILAGCVMLSLLPATLGLLGFIHSITILTLGYGLFQTANNVTVMGAAQPDQRGVVSGLLNLSRNLGLITGASVLGGVFGFAAQRGPGLSPPEAIAAATRVTFAITALLMLAAFAVAIWPRFSKIFNLKQAAGRGS